MDSLIDHVGVMDRFDHDQDIVREIAQLFLEDYPKLFAEVRQAIAQRDAAALQHSAHTLKGSVSNFSPAVAAAVFPLEVIGKSGTVTGAELQLAKIEGLLSALVVELTTSFIARVQV